jgi:DNA (cytosine-5)-methyltransferase 1
VHDPVYAALRSADRPLSVRELRRAASAGLTEVDVEHRLNLLARDFVIEVSGEGNSRAFRFIEFKGFVGQDDHTRHLAFAGSARSKIS